MNRSFSGPERSDDNIFEIQHEVSSSINWALSHYPPLPHFKTLPFRVELRRIAQYRLAGLVSTPVLVNPMVMDYEALFRSDHIHFCLGKNR